MTNTFNLLGCNLSPLLFALFLNNLGHELNQTGLGIDLGGINISCICFADDIILLGKNSQSLDFLMNLTRSFFHHHRLKLSQLKSKIMTHNAATGKISFQGPLLDPLTLDQILSFKYLGIYLSTSHYNLFKSFNNHVKTKAKNYLHHVLALVKSGPDRSELAHTLWTQCALPSILYGTEIIPLTQGTIDEIARCQNLVGKFILQLPKNSTNIVASIDGGLQPVWSLVAEKVLFYSSKVMKYPASYWPKLAMEENLALGTRSPYTKYLIKWKKATNTFGVTNKAMKDNILKAAIDDVVKERMTNSTSSFPMNFPNITQRSVFFKPKWWVNDSGFCKIFAEFRSCNASLGNRGPTKDGRFFKLCPLCSKQGITAINNEVSTQIYRF